MLTECDQSRLKKQPAVLMQTVAVFGLREMGLLINILEKHLFSGGKEKFKGGERLWSNFIDDEESVSVTDNTSMLIGPKISNGKDEQG